MIKTKFKWWWAWNSEKIENWLERKAGEGWLLERCSLAGTLFTFRKADPVRMRYCVDYLHKLKPEYEQLAADDGWNILEMGAGWYVFSKDYEHRRPELYTDTRSLLERNNRLITVLVATGIPSMVIVPRAVSNLENDAAAITIMAIWIPVIMLYIYGMLNLLRVNKDLKRKQDVSD